MLDVTELDNAELDLETLEQVMNASDTTTVVSRLGRPINSIAKTIRLLAETVLTPPDYKGPKGDDGDVGPAGSGVTINVKDAGVLVGTPRDFLNFIGATVTPNGTGVDITLTGGGGSGAGGIDLGALGINPAGTTNAQILQDAIDDAETAGRAGWFVLPDGELPWEKMVTLQLPHRIEGRGQGSAGSTWGDGPTVVAAAPGITAFFFKGKSGLTVGAQRGTIGNVRGVQKAILGTSALASYNPATPGQITINSGTNDYAVGQVVCLTGGGPSTPIVGKGATTTIGSDIVSWRELAADLGNVALEAGMPIDIAGAGLPAGTTVVDPYYDGDKFKVSNPTPNHVVDAQYTVKCPMIGQITAKAGAVLTVDTQPSNTQVVANGVLRHYDCFIYNTCTVNGYSIDTTGFSGAGLASRGGNSAGENADHCVWVGCKWNAKRHGAVCQGNDAQASVFLGCNFSKGGVDNLIGFLDMSLLGNDLISCNFAFNLGCLVALPNAYTKIIGGYVEGGTSMQAPPDSNSCFYGTTGMNIGSGFNGFAQKPGGMETTSLTMTTLKVSGTVGGAAGGSQLTGPFRSKSASYAFRIENNIGSYPLGSTGMGLNFGNDGVRNYIESYNPAGPNYDDVRISAANIELAPGGVRQLGAKAKGAGYLPGTGGTAVQGTSKATAVTLNKFTGQVTTHNANLVNGTGVLFTVNDSNVDPTDTIIAHAASGNTAGAYRVWVDSCASGSFVLGIENRSPGALAEAVTINYSIFKGQNS